VFLSNNLFYNIHLLLSKRANQQLQGALEAHSVEQDRRSGTSSKQRFLAVLNVDFSPIRALNITSFCTYFVTEGWEVTKPKTFHIIQRKNPAGYAVHHSTVH